MKIRYCLLTTLAAAVTTAIVAVYATLPPSVMIGHERVQIGEARIVAAIGDFIGNFKGYFQCPVTGLSMFWAPEKDLATETGGTMFSAYAVNALMRMDSDTAYKIAQDALDNRGNGAKLLYPLRGFPHP